MRKLIATSIIAVGFSSQVTAETCLDTLDVDAKNSYSALVACVQSDLTKQIVADLVANHIDDLRGPKGDPGEDGAAGNNGLPGRDGSDADTIPSGAIVAFDRPNGCPKGWTDFAAAAGRMIVGVDGKTYKLPYVAGKPEYQTGGAPTHELTVAELPKHSHEIPFVPEVSNLSGGSYAVMSDDRHGSSKRDYVTSNTDGGAGRAHNNMPPYIALYLCKKS